MHTSPVLSLPYMQPSQAQKHVTHNLALELLDALVQLSVTDLAAAVPPSDPFEGQVVSVGPGATGDFAGQDGRLAFFSNNGWLFIPPRNGFKAWVEDRGAFYVHQGGSWRILLATGSDAADGLGLNTSWDAENRLSVSSPATLLSHEGAGHRLKVNKAGEEDTASLLFQTGFSGRAEMGLTGGDDFSVKVSADGASWTVAFSVDAASGETAFDAIRASRLGGDAVQTRPDDTTPGRLMRADWGYGPGNLVGPVAQAMGVPTGAAIERGETGTGSYVRLADGTQICTIGTFTTASNAPAQWTFPAPFATEQDLWIGITSSYAGGPRVFASDEATAEGVGIRSWNETGNEAVMPICRIMAVGRWY